ncbi:MAG: hypothetical protein U0694_23900 [Anaerolineae bacterium]
MYSHRKLFLAVLCLAGVIALFLSMPVFADPGGNPGNSGGQNGTTLTASVTATPSWTRTFGWTIDKSASPDNLYLFTGDSGTTLYTITVTKGSGTDSITISGQVCVTNGGAVATENLAISVDLVTPPNNLILSQSVDVSGHPVLAAGESYCYPYSISNVSSSYAGSALKVTAHITITNHSGHLSTPFGPDPSADFVMLSSPTLINDTINVDDTNGASWQFNNSGSVTYSKTFTCDGDAGAHQNTATIRQTGQSDSASVTVHCYALTVVKTAGTTFTRTYQWGIDKSVTPDSMDLFVGDSATATYTVRAFITGYTDSNWAVSGSITISNPAPMNAPLANVSDAMTGGINAAVDCSGATAVPAGGSITCSYSSSLPDGSNRTNTATAVLQNNTGGTTSFVGTAAVTFGNPSTEVDTSIHVVDTNGAAWDLSNGDSVSYDEPFTCDEDGGEHVNIASAQTTSGIVSDDASVTVNCYALGVTKNAETSFTRTYTWTIDKSSQTTSLTLQTGEQYLVTYNVTIGAAYTDSNWAVTGTITIANPAPMDAPLISVSDVLSDGTVANVDCHGATSVPANGSIECDYSASLTDASARTNTATATLQNYADGVPDGSTDFTGSANVGFSDAAIAEIDECVSVTDSVNGTSTLLGMWCYSQGSTHTFTYTRTISYTVCGNYQYTNVAAIVTGDTGTTVSDSHTISVYVPCGACTLTQGYWKTHSAYGPAPTDSGWFTTATPNGPDTTFFLSGRSWYQVFWTPPAGNAYYNLAHQYMAAKLNILNGASSTAAVNAAITAAEAFFNTYTPSSNLSRTARQQALAWAATLDQYNNGLIGPGHCSEQ